MYTIFFEIANTYKIYFTITKKHSIIPLGDSMEIRVLKYFLAVAREENISKAADIIHISQPSLSKQLKELEEELGKKLFIRGSRKITLTEDGILLRKRAQEIIDLVNITEAEITNNTNLTGTINIGCGESKIITIVGKTINKLLKNNSNIQVNIYSGNEDDVTDKLDKGLIDFGILIEPNDIKKYNYYKIPYSDTRGILTTKDNKLAKLKYITKKDLIDVPLICSAQSLKNNELNSLLPDNPNIVATYTLVYNAALMVEENIGSVICLEGLINTANTDLVFIPFKNDSKVYSYLIWKKYQVLSKCCRKFLEEIQKL